MAVYGNQNTENNTKREPRTDYNKLIHNGKQYKTLDEMILRIAKERSNVAFASTKLILAELKSKKTDQEIADAMVTANIKMIMAYLEEKQAKRGLFGLED